MEWLYTPDQDAADSSSDPKGILVFSHDEHDLLVVVAVSLMTCGCREGGGHRVMVNPTGASESLSIWRAGAECLRRREVIPRLHVRRNHGMV